MFCHSIIVVCSILPVLTLEFQLLGLDFERIFEHVGSLEETVRSAAKHWDKLEQVFVSCVERHQTLLKTTAAFRRQLKTYYLIQLGIDFIIIVFTTFMCAFTRQSEDTSFAFTGFAAIANMFNLLLYGFLCDQLEEQEAAINCHLYCSGWTDNADRDGAPAAEDRLYLRKFVRDVAAHLQEDAVVRLLGADRADKFPGVVAAHLPLVAVVCRALS